jgi:hypothetical protein
MPQFDDAIKRCMQGLCRPEELADLLHRIDLPPAARAAIRQTLSLLEGLDQSQHIPEPPAGAMPRLLQAMREQPLPGDAGSHSALRSAIARSQDLLESQDESETRELEQLSAALDAMHQSIRVPPGAPERVAQKLAEEEKDVIAAFASDPPAGQHEDAPASIPFPTYFSAANSPPDVLAASKETPPPSTPAPGKEADKPQPESPQPDSPQPEPK